MPFASPPADEQEPTARHATTTATLRRHPRAMGVMLTLGSSHAKRVRLIVTDP